MLKNVITGIFGLFIVGLVIFGGAGEAKAQKNEDVLKEFTAIYAEIDKITAEKNVEVIDNVLAPDFKAKRDGKEISRDEFLKLQKEATKMIKDITFAESKIEDIEVGKDGEVTVKVAQKIKFIFVKDGKEVESEVVSGSLDIWVKTEDGWKVAYVEDVPAK